MAMSRSAPEPSSETSLRNRRMTARDAAEIARWMIDDLPVPSPLAPALSHVLRALFTEERIFGVRVEETALCTGGGGAGRLAAFGMSAFLSDCCVDAQIASPLPWFALELLDRARRGASNAGLLASREVAAANAGEGCNLFPLLWLQRPRDMSCPEGARLTTRGMHLFLDDHQGYNLKRILKEGSREQERAFTRGGLIRLKSCFIEKGAEVEERILFGLTRDEARAEAFGSAIGLLFSSDRPRCGFSRNQQHVLQSAGDDLTDEEIAAHLNITLHAINMRWRTIYERIQDHPELAAAVFGDGPNGNSGGHGVQKRRRVVAYVRAHPEELRPCAWK